jgi:single-stranded DNA-binding protein
MNVLTLTGRIGDEPVRRDTTKGVVCEFRLAVHGRPRLWITVVTWGHLAGVCAQHLATGRSVAVTGSLQHDQFVTRAGERAERWYCKASQVTFLDKPIDDDEPADVSQAGA